MHPAWERALQACLASLAEGERIVLCGVPGTGKTLLLLTLRRHLRAEGRPVALLRYGAPIAEAGRGEILLVDEADRLSDEQLRQLCLSAAPLLLAGLPELRERVRRCVGLVGGVALEPLLATDVPRLLALRLSRSRRTNIRFAPDAERALMRHSGGLFRLVVILAGAALFVAEMHGASVVTAADVREAASMREVTAEEAEAAPVSPDASPLSRWARDLVMAAVAAVAVVGVAMHLTVAAGDPAAAAVPADLSRP